MKKKLENDRIANARHDMRINTLNLFQWIIYTFIYRFWHLLFALDFTCCVAPTSCNIQFGREKERLIQSIRSNE